MLLLSAVTPNIQQREILIRPRVTVKANAIYTMRKVADRKFLLRLLENGIISVIIICNKNELLHK